MTHAVVGPALALVGFTVSPGVGVEEARVTTEELRVDEPVSGPIKGPCYGLGGTCTITSENSSLPRCGVIRSGRACVAVLCPFKLPGACCLDDGSCLETAVYSGEQQGSTKVGILKWQGWAKGA